MRMTLIVTSVITICAAAAGTGRAAQQPTLDQIVEGLERVEKLFFENSSLLLRYERTSTKDVTPTAFSGGFLLCEWTLAFKGDKWFADRRFTQPSRTKELWIPAEPKTQIIKDRTSLEWTKYGDLAVIEQFDMGGNIYSGLFYTRNMSLDAPRHIVKSNGGDLAAIRKRCADDADLPFLPQFLQENKSKYRVLAAPEDIEGALCWVAEWPGMDKIWVDPQRGFAITRREFAWGPGKPLKYAHRNHDFREVKPGLWLPFRQGEDRYASVVAEKESLWGKVAATNEYTLLAAEFDNVPDSQFEVKLPPGTRVIDMVRDFRYAVSGTGDTDPFTAEIEEARRERQGLEPTGSRKRWIIAAANLVLLAVVGLGWFYRKRIRSGSGP